MSCNEPKASIQLVSAVYPNLAAEVEYDNTQLLGYTVDGIKRRTEYC